MARKKTSLGCLFWLALVLLVIVIFLFNQRNIEHVLKRTGFWDLFRKDDTALDVTINTNDGSQENTENHEENTTEEQPMEIVLDIKEEAPPEEGPAQEEPLSEKEILDSLDRPSTETGTKPHVRKARVYFVIVTPEGGIKLKSVIRSIYFANSPLRETLKTLLDGPSTAELNQGLLSIIPEGTDLRNVYVKGHTAFLDFSDDFRFNSIGQAGLKAQLQQVIFTATEFSNVSDVQILIEGSRQKYLSQEGLYIADPVSRGSIN